MFNKRIHGLMPIAFLRGALLWAVFLLSSWPVLADSTCALLLGGFQDDCIVVTVNNRSLKPRAMMPLNSGDKLIQKSGVDEIVIKCSPFTSVNKLSETTLEIVFQPPEEKKAVLKELRTFLGFEKDNHQRRIAGTRAVYEENDIFFPRPGYRATAMPGEPIKFSWDRKGLKTIVFKNSSGLEVFSKTFEEATSIELTPREINMKPKETYYWQIEIQGVPRSSETYSLKLLEKDIVELVMSDLKKLAEEKLGDTEKKLRIAAYCQFISDTYPKEVDLYWKSYQILKELDGTSLTVEEKNLGQMLRARYIQHIQEQMAAEYK